MLIMEWREERRPIGWTVQRCPCCERTEAFAGFERVLVTRAYFIPVGGRSIGRLLVCDFCASAFDVPGSLDLVQGWKRSDGIARLAERVRPGLETPAPGDTPSQVAIEALIRSLDQRTRTGDQEITRGLWSGGIAGATLGLIIGGVLSLTGISLAPGPVGEQFVSCALLGMLAGPVVGGILEAGRQRLRAIDEALGAAVRNHRVRPPALRAVACRMTPPVPRAVRALAEFRC